MQKKTWEFIMAVLLLAALVFVSKEDGILAGAVASNQEGIVIDPGHGGIDSGKLGINNSLEKEINLQISKKLKGYLEQEKIKVSMTREDDNGLYSEKAYNKKAEDMQKRCQIISQENPMLTVSIHQNSFEDESVDGPQVFYYEESPEGKSAAECIQEELNLFVGEDRARQIKSNDNYYMLKKTSSPTVIVECGFLSNWEEAKLLSSEEYQKQIAEVICKGSIKYLEK